jgi:hypothetical protein
MRSGRAWDYRVISGQYEYGLFVYLRARQLDHGVRAQLAWWFGVAVVIEVELWLVRW